MTERKRIAAIGLGVLVIALALRLYGLGWGLPAVYEEAYPFKKSWDMWGWGAQAKFDPNPHFFNYPTFYFYVQFLGQGLLFLFLKLTGAVHSTLDYRVLYELDKTPFYIMGRGISALCGVATVLVTYWLGRRAGNTTVGLIAAALVAVNQTHIAKSQVIEVDVPMTLLATLCCLFALRILESPRRRDYLWAGICGGLATSTKYNGALLFLPIVLAHLLVVLRQRQAAPAAPARRGGGTRPATPVAPRTLDLVLAMLVFGVVVLATSPYIVLDRANFWVGFNYERQHMKIGHFGLDDQPAILYYLHAMTHTLFGWPLALLALGGFVLYAGVRRQQWAWVLTIFPVVYLILISSWSMKAERYILPLLPIAAVLAAQLVVELGARLQARLGAQRTWLPQAVTVLALLAMAAPSLAAYRRDLGRLRGDTRTIARQWIETNLPAGSLVVSEPYGPEPMSAIDMQNLDQDVRERIQKERPDTKVYAIMAMPMYQVRPENTSIFYDIQLYNEVADLIVICNPVVSRYRKNPAQFVAQNAFYDSLEAHWTKRREFGPADGAGPRITVYANPRPLKPFAQRGDVPAPPPPPVVPDLLPGSFSGWFERLAFNYEYYGYKAAAAQIYQMGLRYPDQPAEVRRSLGLGALRASLAAGRTNQMVAILDQLEQRAAGPNEATYWHNLRLQLLAPARRDTTAATPTP